MGKKKPHPHSANTIWCSKSPQAKNEPCPAGNLQPQVLSLKMTQTSVASCVSELRILWILQSNGFKKKIKTNLLKGFKDPLQRWAASGRLSALVTDTVVFYTESIHSVTRTIRQLKPPRTVTAWGDGWSLKLRCSSFDSTHGTASHCVVHLKGVRC